MTVPAPPPRTPPQTRPGPAPELHSEFQRHVFRALRVLGWPVDYVLSRDMPGCPPAATSHDGFIRWCLSSPHPTVAARLNEGSLFPRFSNSSSQVVFHIVNGIGHCLGRGNVVQYI